MRPKLPHVSIMIYSARTIRWNGILIKKVIQSCQIIFFNSCLSNVTLFFFFVVLHESSKYSKMTPKFVKQKSHWLHSSIKFANPVHADVLLGFYKLRYFQTYSNFNNAHNPFEFVPELPAVSLSSFTDWSRMEESIREMRILLSSELN